MNSVSWFIYGAQVSGSLGTMFCVFGGMGIAAIGLYTFAATLAASIEADNLAFKTAQARYFALVMVFILIGNLMPARETMYAIAASEVGERIVKSDAVQGLTTDATKALQQWIKRQIEPEAKK